MEPVGQGAASVQFKPRTSAVLLDTNASVINRDKNRCCFRRAAVLTMAAAEISFQLFISGRQKKPFEPGTSNFCKLKRGAMPVIKWDRRS